MKKQYVKPMIDVEEIEMSYYMLAESLPTSGNNNDTLLGDEDFLSKPRGIFDNDNTLWLFD